jgi:hypothetical protein
MIIANQHPTANKFQQFSWPRVFDVIPNDEQYKILLERDFLHTTVPFPLVLVLEIWEYLSCNPCRMHSSTGSGSSCWPSLFGCHVPVSKQQQMKNAC